jgi:hypothetical protein
MDINILGMTSDGLFSDPFQDDQATPVQNPGSVPGSEILSGIQAVRLYWLSPPSTLARWGVNEKRANYLRH